MLGKIQKNTLVSERKNYLDGLRGIAIIAVIIFHIDSDYLPGGFLGVDIFFVLSGFLITTSIINITNESNFSFYEFYKRRFFRIVPAMLFTIAIVMFVGFYILLPEEFNNLSKSIYKILLISSNILASQSIDYFGIKTDYQPLIHFWSLSVELHFYILFPVFMFYIYIKWSLKALSFFLLGITIFSILYATLATNLTNSESYFSTFTRIWEFSLGALLHTMSIIYKSKIDNLNIYLKNTLLSLSLVMLVGSFFIFDKSFSVPGILTIFPLLGVACIIMLSNNKLFTTKILSIYPFRYIGIISFSLYLVHQPVLAFHRILLDRNLLFNEIIISIFIMTVLAIIMFYLVERTFQSNKNISNRVKLISLVVMVLILFLISHEGKRGHIEPYNMSDKVKRFLSFRYNNNPRMAKCRVGNFIINPENTCSYGEKQGKPDIAFWGDSHIDQIILPLSMEFNKYGQRVLEFSVSGCPPILDVSLSNGTRKCYENSQKIHNFLLHNESIKDIVIFSYWNYYTTNNILKYDGKDNLAWKEDAYDKMIQKSFKKTIQSLIIAGKRLHIIYPSPEMNVNPPLHKARLEKILANGNNIVSINKSEFRAQSKKSKIFLDNTTKKLKLNKIYIADFLEENHLYVANNSEFIFYRDDNHLSLAGGNKVAKAIVEKFYIYNKANVD